MKRLLLLVPLLAAGCVVVPARHRTIVTAHPVPAVPPPPLEVWYYGEHFVPDSRGGGWCYEDTAHVHDYYPEQPHLYVVENGYYLYRGPYVFTYVEGHPLPGGGWCTLRGPHTHEYAPPRIRDFEWRRGRGWVYVGPYRQHRPPPASYWPAPRRPEYRARPTPPPPRSEPWPPGRPPEPPVVVTPPRPGRSGDAPGHGGLPPGQGGTPPGHASPVPDPWQRGRPDPSGPAAAAGPEGPGRGGDRPGEASRGAGFEAWRGGRPGPEHRAPRLDERPGRGPDAVGARREGPGRVAAPGPAQPTAAAGEPRSRQPAGRGGEDRGRPDRTPSGAPAAAQPASGASAGAEAQPAAAPGRGQADREEGSGRKGGEGNGRSRGLDRPRPLGR